MWPHPNSARNNSKKKKTEQEIMEDFAEKMHMKHLKLNKEEIKKILIIFQELISIGNEEESFLEKERNTVDGAVSILLILAQQISELLEGEIDFLEFHNIIKKSLKTLKAILGVFNTVKNNIRSKLKTGGKNQINSQS